MRRLQFTLFLLSKVLQISRNPNYNLLSDLQEEDESSSPSTPDLPAPNRVMIIPVCELTPTAVITNFPEPSIAYVPEIGRISHLNSWKTRLPERRTGSDSTDFFMWSDSPVREDSSIWIIKVHFLIHHIYRLNLSSQISKSLKALQLFQSYAIFAIISSSQSCLTYEN